MPDILQDIWKIHTEVQEQMLQLRSVPISVIPESAKIVGEKLFLQVDENDKTEIFINSIAEVFKIDADNIHINNGYFFVDKRLAENVSIEQKKHLRERASANFIDFLPHPIIDGYINKLKSPIGSLQDLMDKAGFDYDFDKKGRLQITLNNLESLNQIISSDKITIEIPELSSIILPVYPNPLYFIKKEFSTLKATHKTKSYRTNGNNEIHWSRTIEIEGGYFNKEIEDRLKNEIGLLLVGYDYIFYINPNVIANYDPKISPYILPQLNGENNSFVFHTNLKNKSEDKDMQLAYNEEKWDFDLKYTRLIKFFNSFFGADNVRFKSRFIYTYDLFKYTTEFLPTKEYPKEEFWQEIYNSILIENVSVSESTGSIGIDFNWKNEDVETVILSTIDNCPYLNFSFFKDHKCNIDFQIQDISLDESEELLREKFPSIQTKRNNKNGTIYFYQEYQSQEQSIILRDMIQSELSEFNTNVFETGLHEIPKNKDKFFLYVDNQAKKESQVTAIKELRGADFNVNGNYLGKLIRISFPVIIFDISGDNFEKNKQLFTANDIDEIEPNLTGDIEKINRLKSSLTNIINGTKLHNPNLKDFIFNSKRAKKIDEINHHLNPQSDTFIDLDNHLLNNKVNESQKQAIIKTLLAEDLAIIQGPPGTGKSTAIAEIIWQHIRKNPQERILLTSETNLAVDNAIDRIVNNNHNLVKPIRFGGEEKLEMEGRQFSIESMKRWVENGVVEVDMDEKNEDEESLPQKLILLNWLSNIKRRIEQAELDDNIYKLWEITLSNPSKSIRNAVYNSYVKNCNVIGATCSSIGEKNTKGNPTNFFRSYCEIFGSIDRRTSKEGKEYSSYKGDLRFTTVIQDESSKATPAELSLPLIYGKKNIIIGDHRQLPPLLDKESFMLSFDFLLDRIEDEEENKKIKKLKTYVNKHFDKLEISHFERLFEGIDDSLKGVFNLQYRMHPDINEVIKQFYIEDGGLECGLTTPIDLGVNDPDMNNPASRYHGIEIDDLVSSNNHVIWIDTDSPELLDGTSRINYGEVEAIHEVLTKFRESDSFNKYQKFWNNYEDQQIGLISFYNKQIRLLRNLRNKFNDIPIRVSTVDRFQGMERNIIIVSMVRSNRIATDKNQKPDKVLFGDLGFQEQLDLGFAQSPNRLNVALSRAKRLLIIVGNSELFRQKKIYNSVYQTIASNPNGRIIKYETK